MPKGNWSIFILPGSSFSSVQLLSRVQLFVTPWITARQAFLSITNSRSSLQLMSIESVMSFSHFVLCRPLLLLPQSLPESESFPMSQLFAWGGQSIGVSALASVLPKNTKDWSPLEWTGWISLQYKGFSRVFSNTYSSTNLHKSNCMERVLRQTIFERVRTAICDNFHCFKTMYIMFLTFAWLTGACNWFHFKEAAWVSRPLHVKYIYKLVAIQNKSIFSE